MLNGAPGPGLNCQVQTAPGRKDQHPENEEGRQTLEGSQHLYIQSNYEYLDKSSGTKGVGKLEFKIWTWKPSWGLC